jgi:F-type H+-transporting ATPase subunit b
MFLAPALLAAEGAAFNPLNPLHGGLALWTWIIFLLALIPVWKMVMGPVSRALLDRDQEAFSAVRKAEQASAEAERARAEVEVKLGEARAEAAKIVAAARERGEMREREIFEKAKTEAAALLDSARSQIRSEQEKAIATIRAEVVDLSLRAAGKVLERQVSAEDDRRLVSQFVSQNSGA